MTVNRTDLATSEDVQRLVHLSSSIAISSKLSIQMRLSAFMLSLPVNTMSILLRYRHLVAVRLVTSNMIARKGAILADTRNTLSLKRLGLSD